MKTRFSFLLVLLGIFLLTPLAISGTATDRKSNDTFTLSYTTISTSKELAGYGSKSWHVTGNASISGNAIELGQDGVYDCELWLYASGDIDSSPFPGKNNIAAEAGSGCVSVVLWVSIDFKQKQVSRSIRKPQTCPVLRSRSFNRRHNRVYALRQNRCWQKTSTVISTKPLSKITSSRASAQTCITRPRLGRP